MRSGTAGQVIESNAMITVFRNIGKSVTPDSIAKQRLSYFTFALKEECSNNEAEYKSVIAELELALRIPIEELTIYGDSELIVKQLRGEYVVRKVSLVPYHKP